MKNILFAAVNMEMGGIETSLVTLLNYLVNKYNITLVLEAKKGILLNELDSRINIIEYKPSNLKNVFLRKIINATKRIKFILKYKNKFDFSASFATYSKMSSFVARTASNNNALWGHANYLDLYKGDIKKVKEFFNGLNYNEFKHVIFVAKEGKKTFLEVFPEMEDKTIFCNNLIDYQNIINLSEEKIEETKSVFTFVNVGRHDEKQKKLTRLIEASKKLKEDGIKFKLLFIGEGEDTDNYKKQVQEYKLEEEIKFLGIKKNPYPYMKMSDAIILTSDYEGYPVVFLEARTLNKPIITTEVSDAMEDINNKYGIVVKKDVNDIYMNMKQFIEKGYKITEKFDPKKYNEEIISKIEQII